MSLLRRPETSKLCGSQGWIKGSDLNMVIFNGLFNDLEKKKQVYSYIES